MGGRGSMGGTRSSYRGTSTSDFMSRGLGPDGKSLFPTKPNDGGGVGGGGSSGGGSSKSPANASTGGVTTSGGGKSGGGGSSSNTTINQQPLTEDLRISFGPGFRADDRADQKIQLEEMPEALRMKLQDRGVTVNVGKRADSTPGWLVSGISDDERTEDGYSQGELTFYNAETKQVFISTDFDSTSVNVITHELSHAIDYEWLDDPAEVEYPAGSGTMFPVYAISQDPYWQEVHLEIINRPSVDNYFKYELYDPPPPGVEPSDEALEAGRMELFAEGLAAYFDGGIAGLKKFLDNDSDLSAQAVAVWQRYGVI